MVDTDLSFDPRVGVNEDIARLLFFRINKARERSDTPFKPLIGEMFGPPKSGKNSQLVGVERYFKRLGFQVYIPQESAEVREVRAMSRKAVGPFSFEMRHFLYGLTNLLDAVSSRDFHLVLQNRGITDTLCWLEVNRRLGLFTKKQISTVKSFILNGDFMQYIDFMVYLSCSPEEALKREYGPDWRNAQFGSRMNHHFLTTWHEAGEAVVSELVSKYGVKNLVQINSEGRTIEETKSDILEGVISVLSKNLVNISDESCAIFIPSLLRLRAVESCQELKFKGHPDMSSLMSGNWRLIGSVQEKDIYLKPKHSKVLQDDECFLIRSCGDKHYFIYKQRRPDELRCRIPAIPINAQAMFDLVAYFDKVVEISKTREIYLRDNVIVNIDNVENLGIFCELKVPVEFSESQVSQLMAELGLKTEDKTSSYLRLLMGLKD